MQRIYGPDTDRKIPNRSDRFENFPTGPKVVQEPGLRRRLRNLDALVPTGNRR
jgi:hypothetical protein